MSVVSIKVKDSEIITCDYCGKEIEGVAFRMGDSVLLYCKRDCLIHDIGINNISVADAREDEAIMLWQRQKINERYQMIRRDTL